MKIADVEITKMTKGDYDDVNWDNMKPFYTNIAKDEMPDIPIMCFLFEKHFTSRVSEMMFQVYIQYQYMFLTSIYPPIVGSICPIQIYVIENVHSPSLCPKGTQTPPK